VKRKTHFYSSSIFRPLEHIDFFCPLLQSEKVGNPTYRTLKANREEYVTKYAEFIGASINKAEKNMKSK